MVESLAGQELLVEVVRLVPAHLAELDDVARDAEEVDDASEQLEPTSHRDFLSKEG